MSKTAEQVTLSVEALCKATYEKMFLWIVKRVNQSLDRTKGRGGKQFIGILDIAGFEIFDVNSFEQLLINFTNEKLQQLFNRRMFILEQEEYRKEGIKWDFIDFGLDLQGTIDLIERQTAPHLGLLSLLDNSSLVPKATDLTFVETLDQYLAKDVRYVTQHDTQHKLRLKGHFAIRHYAGLVAYDAAHWLVKNKDPLNESVVALFKESGNSFIKMLWTEVSVAAGGATPRGQRGTFRTVGFIYREQLAHLLETLNATIPHFIRCIIPNHEKRPGRIDANLILHQLRCNGVLEGIRIVRQGFPNRVLFAEFRQRYELLTPSVLGRGITDGRQAVEKMVGALLLEGDSYRIGFTKVFFRTGVLSRLEEERDSKLSGLILGLQTWCRGKLARLAFRFHVGDHQAADIVQRNVKAYLRLRTSPWWRLYCKVRPQLGRLNKEREERNLVAEMAKLQADMEAQRATRAKTEAELAVAQQTIAELKERADADSQVIGEYEASIGALSQQKAIAEEDALHADEQLERVQQAIDGLKVQMRALAQENADLKADMAKGSSADAARMARLDQEKADLQALVASSNSRATAAEEARKVQMTAANELSAKVESVQAELKAATKAKAKAEHALADLDHELQTLRGQVANSERVGRKHAQELGEEQARTKAATDETSRIQADLRKTQTEVLTMREGLEHLTGDFEKADKERKQLRVDMEAATSKDEADRELTKLRGEVRKLQEANALALQDRDDALDEAMRYRREKDALGVDLHQLKTRPVEVEDDSGRRGLQRQLQATQADVEDQAKARSRLATEKRRLEADVKAAQDRLDEELSTNSKHQRNIKKLEQKLVIAAEENKRLLEGGGATSTEVERLRSKVKEVKAALVEEVRASGTDSEGGGGVVVRQRCP